MPIPEIVVRGRRRRPDWRNAFADEFDFIEDAREAREEEQRERREEAEEAREGFLAPAVPRVVEEIVAKAKRPPPRVPIGPVGGIIAGVAMVGAAMADVISQRRLEESFEVLMRPARKRKDTPVRTVADPQPIPEIVVTARRTPRRARPVGFTFISPDADPFEMIPVRPRVLPATPTAVPDVAVPAPEIPQRRRLPLEIPLVAPPTILPQIDPGTRVAPGPSPQPVVSPQPGPTPGPQIDPLPQPLPVPTPIPLTPPQPTPVQFAVPTPFASPFQLPFPMPQLSQRDPRCPPCKKPTKEKEKKRRKCFKKLVVEGLTKRFDTEFKWTQVDCLTGREL